jgi:predicted porin
MKMNKKLLGLAMMLAVQGAYAQTAPSSIEIYGIFDIGIGHSSHSPSEDSTYPAGMTPLASKFGNHSVTGMFNGGESASRIGFRGTEAIDSDLKAVFNLETGFQPQFGTLSNGINSLQRNTSTNQTTVDGDSSLNGQLFNRQANAGLSSNTWGTVTFGRNYTLGQDTLTVYDPLDGSQVFSPFGYSGSYSGGGFTENLRLDNSVRWKYVSKSTGINVGALYKFGGQSGSTSAQTSYQATAGYVNGPFGIQVGYEKYKDAISAASSATLGTLNLTLADTTAYMIAAGYKMDNSLHFRGGYERQKFDNPSNPDLDKGITTIYGAPVGTISTTAFTHQRKYDIYFGGVNYDFTPAFTASIAYYQINQNDYSNFTCTTGTNVSSCGGKSRYYSIRGDYSLSKRTSIYAGYMYNRVAGGFASGFLQNSNNLLGAGIKHSF